MQFLALTFSASFLCFEKIKKKDSVSVCSLSVGMAFISSRYYRLSYFIFV